MSANANRAQGMQTIEETITSSEATQTQGATAARGLSRRGFLKLAGASLVGASMMLVLPGCGDDAADDASSSSASSDVDSSTQATTTSSEAKEIKIVVMNQNKPFCYLDTDGTTIAGYDVESLKLCEEKLEGKYTFSFDAMDFNTMISSLQSGSCDMVSCCLVPNDERREKFLFPDEPYLITPMIMIVPKDSGYKTMADLAGKTIVTSPVTYEYGMLKAYNEENPDLAVELKEYDASTSADYIRMVANGQADGYLAYESGFDDLVAAAGVEVDKTDVVITESCYYMVSQTNQELCDDLTTALQIAKEDGSLSELSEKWFKGTDVFSAYADVLSDNELLAEAKKASSSSAEGKSASTADASDAADAADSADEDEA